MQTSPKPSYDKEHILANLDTCSDNRLTHQAIITFAQQDLDFALKVFNPKSLTILRMHEDDLIALFTACSTHKDRTVYRYLLLYPTMHEFAKQHELLELFKVNRSIKSKPRSLTPPPNLLFFPLKFVPRSKSMPNSPKTSRKKFETALFLLRTTILRLFEVLPDDDLPFIKEGTGMRLINQLYLDVNTDADHLESTFEVLRALLTILHFPNMEASREKAIEYIDLELISSFVSTKWSREVEASHKELTTLFQQLDPNNACTKNNEFIKNLEKLTAALTNHLYVFTGKQHNHEVYQTMRNCLLINFYCALINLISINPDKLNPFTTAAIPHHSR